MFSRCGVVHGRWHSSIQGIALIRKRKWKIIHWKREITRLRVVPANGSHSPRMADDRDVLELHGIQRKEERKLLGKLWGKRIIRNWQLWHVSVAERWCSTYEFMVTITTAKYSLDRREERWKHASWKSHSCWIDRLQIEHSEADHLSGPRHFQWKHDINETHKGYKKIRLGRKVRIYR